MSRARPLRVLTLPGEDGAGATHWQTLWERLDQRVLRVEQVDWHQPQLARLREVLAREPGPVVLVGEGFGASLAVQAADCPDVIGALLVEPCSSQPLPRTPLPWPAIVVGNAELAACWGARSVAQRPEPGTWPAGRALLRELCARAPFALDPRLAADTTLVGHGPLSDALWFDDARYPWLVLVPRRSAVSELHELEDADRAVLAHESHVVALAMSRALTPDKLNVAALGNVVRQLHVHHVARRLGDPAWPGPVWGHSPRVPYTASQRSVVLEQLWRDEAFARLFRKG